MRKNRLFFMMLACVVTMGLQTVSGADTGAVSAASAGPQETSFTGTVVETMNASRYTYVLVDTGPAKRWAAAPVFPVKVGDPVSVSGGMPTKDFYSTALKRTFDELYLVGRILTPGSASPAPVESPAELPPGHPSINPKGDAAEDDAAAVSTDFSGIQKPEGGKTVAEIWKDKSPLAGKPVVVRAKVVKVIPEIMDRYWLHLRDGTGSEGQNDLTVTTKTAVRAGEIVTVTGILSTDKDFGSGYKYAVIIEDAEIAK